MTLKIFGRLLDRYPLRFYYRIVTQQMGGGQNTMPVIKYNPFNTEVDEFPAGLRVFQDSLSRLFSEPASRPWSPAVDIVETENELILKADVPDIDPKNVGIQL